MGKPGERLTCIGNGLNYILGLPDGKQRFTDEFREFKKAYALAAATVEAEKIREEVAFFEAVYVQLGKRSLAAIGATTRRWRSGRSFPVSCCPRAWWTSSRRGAGAAARSRCCPRSSWPRCRDMPQRNLAVEMLERLLLDEIKVRGKRNVVLERRFSQLLEAPVIKYRNRAIDSAMVIQELVDLARELREAGERGEALGSTRTSSRSTRRLTRTATCTPSWATRSWR